jgi:hypothetical protein
MSSWITIESYKSRIEAELIKGYLNTNGIPSIIFADDAGGVRPFPLSYSFGVVLKVQKKDLDKARELLLGNTSEN